MNEIKHDHQHNGGKDRDGGHPRRPYRKRAHHEVQPKQLITHLTLDDVIKAHDSIRPMRFSGSTKKLPECGSAWKKPCTNTLLPA